MDRFRHWFYAQSSAFHQNLDRIAKVIQYLIRLVGSGVLGIYLKNVFNKLSARIASATLWDTATFSELAAEWPVLVGFAFIGIAELIGTVLKRRQNFGQNALSELKQIYAEMGFRKAEKVDDDIRCVIWVNDSTEKLPKTLRQFSDYHPPQSQVKVNGGYTNYKRAGRRFTMMREEKGSTRPVGLLGECARRALNGAGPETLCVKFENEEELRLKLTKDYNFTDSDIAALTPNRLSFICVPMMNATKTKLIGILYFDSRTPTGLTKTFGKKIERYTPALAALITGQKEG